MTFTGSLYFERNYGDRTCTFEAAHDSKVIFAEYTSFCDNHAGIASGNLCISSGSNATFIEGRTNFIKNRGEDSAGTICGRNSSLGM